MIRVAAMETPLSSWKEVAAYLGKGVRTVQRWEQQFGLPVRRPSPNRHVIFALPSELDAWLKRQQPSNNHAVFNPRPLSPKSLTEQDRLLKELRKRLRLLSLNRREIRSSVTRLRAGLREIKMKNGRTHGNSKSTTPGTAADAV